MANANQTAKTAADTAADTMRANADAGRDMFRKGVDGSLNAFGELNTQSKRNLEAFADSAAVATDVAQKLSAQAAAYGRKAMEDQVAVAKQLAGAKTFQEAFEIQSGYAKSAMDQYLAEANRWTETMTDATVRAWQPINDRMSAAVSQVNAR
ncbi:MAG TPA: TIGR01841 family phasin [Caulobacteraceae bacterium]|jgi:phasin family protein